MIVPRMVSYAVSYADIGWYIFPVHGIVAGRCTCGKKRCVTSAGKHPKTQRGHLDATIDKEELIATIPWECNLGLRCGHESGIVVLDIDPRNGGDESLAALVRTHGSLPRTVVCATGGGGTHYYFRHPRKGPIRSGAIDKGIDVKADGGYVVIPPSTHRSGLEYTWRPGTDPFTIPVADLPPWLSTMCRPMKPIDKTESKVPKDHPVLGSVLGKAFAEMGMIGRVIDDTKITVVCPWRDEHTSGHDHDSSTVLFSSPVGERWGWFHCSHSHCAGRTISDVLSRLPITVVDAAKIAVPEVNRPENWLEKLKRTKEGRLRNDVLNCSLVLEHDPRMEGLLSLNKFTLKIEKRRPPPWGGRPGDWTDEDSIALKCWFSEHWDVTFSTDNITDGVNLTAKRTPFHPVKDWFDSLEWDGTHRINRWLVEGLGADDIELNHWIGTWWMLSIVARVYDPGCQVDSMLILEGRQGIGKSTALRVLVGDQWFSDELGNVGDKDAILQLQGNLVIELSELDAISRVEASRIKAFVSRRVDNFRPPYGRGTVKVPRQCVFAGTTNYSQYLRDDTGGRRFWPVKCTKVSLYWLSENRNRLWAEAVEKFRSGIPWHPETSVLTEQLALVQEDRYEEDSWESVISRWVKTREGRVITTEEIFESALMKERATWTKRDTMRIASIMRRLGWTKTRTWFGKERKYGWLKETR